MTDTPSPVFGGIEIDEQACIDILRRLISAQSNGEGAVQAVVEDTLIGCGASVHRMMYEPSDVPLTGEFAARDVVASGERLTLLGTRAGSGGGRSLILFAHPDSEPVAGTERWTREPFRGTISEGRLYGWGVADDLLGVAAGLAALMSLNAAGLTTRGDVVFASTPSKRHARGVSAALAAGLSADAALYLHPAESGEGLAEIKAFASGQLEFRVTVTGQKPPTTEPGHTALAHLAINPVDKAVLLYQALRALDARRGARVHHPLLEAAVGRSTNLQISHMSCGNGEKMSRIAVTCTIGGAVSFPPTERLEDVQREIEEAIDGAVAADAWMMRNPPKLEWLSGVSAAETPEAHPLYRCAQAAIRAVTGIEPHVNPLHTSSDIRNPIIQRGIPTVGLGSLSGNLTQSGFVDEWVDVKDYLNMVKVVSAIILDWSGAHHAD
jgi:acetylornithine deacetylase